MIEADNRTLDERFNAALERYERTIYTFARNCVYKLPGFDVDDVAQELRVVLWKSVKGYDPNKGATFNTLFQGNAKRHIISLIRAAETQKRSERENVVQLDPEAFTVATEQIATEASAEDWYIGLQALTHLVPVPEKKTKQARRAS